MKRVFSGKFILPAVVTTVSAVVQTALMLTRVFSPLLKPKRQRTRSEHQNGKMHHIGDHHDGPNI